MQDLSGRWQGAINADRTTFYRRDDIARLALALTNRFQNF